jgi:hypothetical protein
MAMKGFFFEVAVGHAGGAEQAAVGGPGVAQFHGIAAHGF